MLYKNLLESFITPAIFLYSILSYVDNKMTQAIFLCIHKTKSNSSVERKHFEFMTVIRFVTQRSLQPVFDIF